MPHHGRRGIHVTKGRREWAGAVPEASAVGESQSSGRAERSDRRVEDQPRTLIGELEDRTGVPLKPDHPLLSRIVEYRAVLLNKCNVNEATWLTAYQYMHGKTAADKLAYGGERVFCLTPKRRRSNLDLRWATSVYLGSVMTKG